MPLFLLQTLRRPFAAAVLLAVVWPSLTLLAEIKTNHSLEPLDVPDPSESAADPLASATPASSPAAEAATTLSYAGEIRRYPTDGSPALNGYLSLAISPLGKVTGSISWYNPAQQVKITGRQDLNTRQGDFVIRDANGAKVPGALRLPFRISKKNRLVGGGIMASGEASSFRLNRQTLSTSGGGMSAGGATLSLGAVNTYSGASAAVNVSVGTLNTANLGSGAVSVNSGSSGSVVAGTSPVASLTGSGTGVLSLTGATTVIGTSGVNVYSPTITAEGNLVLGNTLLLLGPVTTTTGTDGTVTYTGTYPSGAAGTVIVRGTATGG